MLGIGGDREDITEQLRLLDGPFQQLLTSHAAPDADMDLLDAQRLFQRPVSTDHIPGRKKREIMKIRSLAIRVFIMRTNAAIATARHVDANDKVFRRVEEPALSY